MTKQKKIILISAGILIIGGLVYWFFFRPKPEAAPPGERPPIAQPETPAEGETSVQVPPEGEEGATTPPSEEVLATEEKLIQLTDYPVIGPALNKNEDKVLFYKKEGGDLWSSDFRGKKQTKESSITIINLMEAVWSPDRSRAAVFYLDKETKKGFIHIGTSSVAILPQDIKSFSWSPDGKSATYLLAKDTNTDLVIADNLGRGSRTVLSLPVHDLQLFWPSSDKIYLQSSPSGLAEGSLFLFSRSRGTLERIKNEILGLMTSWSPDGLAFLITSTDTGGKNLQTMVNDATGKEIYSSYFPTIPDKCAWASSKQIYCALAVNIPSDSVMPDDYLRGELTTEDQIAMLDLNTKQVLSVFSDLRFDITDILITKKQDYLFFVNRTDGTLWSLRLP